MGQKEIYEERHTLQLEHLVSKLNVKEYEMWELHYPEKNETTGTIYESNMVSGL